MEFVYNSWSKNLKNVILTQTTAMQLLHFVSIFIIVPVQNLNQELEFKEGHACEILFVASLVNISFFS
jgi:hypothetical protein